jgi:hypothetical protein
MSTSTPEPAKSAAPKRARCTSKRRDGEDCQGFAVERGLCIAHSGKGRFDTATARQAQARKAQLAAERRQARSETLRDKLARQLEEQAGMITSRLSSIVESGTDADALRAIEAWLSRVYGKPTERLEVEERGTDVADLSLAELLAERDRIVQASSGDGVVGPSGE